jgi:phosphopantetheinyl transferase
VLLRTALSRACGGSIAETSWRFGTLPGGKPVTAAGLPRLHFSVSHTDEIAVVAVSPDRELGVDAELLDQAIGEDVIAAFLSADEQRAIGGEPALRATRFVRLWTLKEAYTKLLGDGLAADLSRIDFDPVEPRLRATPYGHADAQFETFVLEAPPQRWQVSLAAGALREASRKPRP